LQQLQLGRGRGRRVVMVEQVDGSAAPVAARTTADGPRPSDRGLPDSLERARPATTALAPGTDRIVKERHASKRQGKAPSMGARASALWARTLLTGLLSGGLLSGAWLLGCAAPHAPRVEAAAPTEGQRAPVAHASHAAAD